MNAEIVMLYGTLILSFCFVVSSFDDGISQFYNYERDRSPIQSLSMSSATPSSITLKWIPLDFAKDFTNDPSLYFEVAYHFQLSKYKPMSLKWDDDDNSFEVVGQHLNRSAGPWITKVFRASDIKMEMNALFMTVTELEFSDTEYEFRVEGYAQEKLQETKYVTARTSSTPPTPPRVDAGCFYVYPINSSHSKRTVRVYWYRMRAQGEILAYEDGTASAVYSGSNIDLYRGFLELPIGMKRHIFVFRAQNEAGWSNTSSTLVVPAQTDILPAISHDFTNDNSSRTGVLMWNPLPDIDVTNYTLFLVDNFRRVSTIGYTAYRLIDFAVIPRNRTNLLKSTWFEIDNAGDDLGFGMSVNTENSSSGLHIKGMSVWYDEDE